VFPLDRDRSEISRKQRIVDEVLRQDQDALDRTAVTAQILRRGTGTPTAAALLANTGVELAAARRETLEREQQLPREAFARATEALDRAQALLADAQSQLTRSRTTTTVQGGVVCDSGGGADGYWFEYFPEGNDALGALADATDSLDPFVSAIDPEGLADDVSEIALDGAGGTTIVDTTASVDDQADNAGGIPDEEGIPICVPANGADTTSGTTAPPPAAPPAGVCAPCGCLPCTPELHRDRIACPIHAYLPLEDRTARFGATAVGTGESWCERQGNSSVTRHVRICLISQKDNSPFESPPPRTRRCNSKTHFGITRRVVEVRWYCRKKRDWTTRVTATVLTNGVVTGRGTTYSLESTLNCP
jgi:hypothetical protein